MTHPDKLTRAEKEAILTRLIRTWPFFQPEEVVDSLNSISALSDEQLLNAILDMQELHEK